jgi:tRNA(fMet)-specific endonuclease VapC
MSRFLLDTGPAQKFVNKDPAIRRFGERLRSDVSVATSLAIALTLGDCTVVTFDSDLAAVPGLSVENWQDSP